MFGAFDKYIAIVVVGAKQKVVYRMDFFISFLFRIFSSLLMIAVWSSIYSSSKLTNIGGFTLSSMYLYFFLVNAVSIVGWNEGVAENIQDDIQSGMVTTALIRPMAYPTQVFLNSVADNLFSWLSVTLPFLLLITVFGHLALSLHHIALFLVEIGLSFVISTFIFFLLGTTAVYLINIWGMIAITESLYFLLGGGVVPLNLLPPWIGGIVALLPMQLALYVPAATLLGTISTSQIISSLEVGAVWAAALFLISAAWWRHVSTRLTSVGG